MANLNLKSNITYTQDQRTAFTKLNEFIKSKNLIFTLSGSAGTGKTTVLNEFLNNQCSHLKIAVTAPTHKAVRIVEKITGFTGKTLHSLHGLRPNTDLANFDISNPQFDPFGNPQIQYFNLLVVDECSQVNRSLKQLNESKARLYNVKIIYVGDKYQLPPINETISSTFSENGVELKEIVRQKDTNPVIDLLQMLRYDIEKSRDTFLKEVTYCDAFKYHNKETNEGLIILNREDFNSLLYKKFTSNPKEFQYIAWKNETVNNYAYDIRREITQSTDILVKGDLLMGYNNIYDDFLTLVLINSETYEVTNVVKGINDYGYEVFYIKLKSEFASTQYTFQVLNHKHYESLVKYTNKLTTLHTSAVKATHGARRDKWKEYYDFKNSILTMIDIPISTPHGKTTYANRDLNYNYSITAHKSQGSTFTNVFTDIHDIIYFTNGKLVKNNYYNPKAEELRNKLLYVALSRANKNNYVVI